MAQTVYTQPPLQSEKTVVTNNFNYGSDPLQVQCYNCHAMVTTATKKSPNLICCFCFGCWAYCCPGCQDAEHRCPNCNVILDVHKAC